MEDFTPETMVDPYLECVLFTDLPDGEVGSGEFSAGDRLRRFGKREREAVADDIRRFLEDAKPILDRSDYRPDQAARDFWFTRCGHGCGFWDQEHCSQSDADALTTIAKRFPAQRMYKAGGWYRIEGA